MLPTAFVLAAGIQVQTVIRGDRPECQQCLRIDSITTLEFAPSAGVMDPRPWSATVGANGDVFLVTADWRLVQYGARGRLVRVAARGQGPGEFQRPQLVLRYGDSVLVFDRAGRMSVLGPDGSYTRSIPWTPATTFDMVVVDNRLVINGIIQSRARIGFPLHSADLGGEPGLAFGSRTPDFRFDAPPTWRRRLARGRSSTVWALRELQYQAESWQLGDSARMRASFRREVQWFPAQQEYEVPTPARAPLTVVTDAQEDSSGRLWVLVTVPGPNWQRALGPERRSPYGDTYYQPEFFDSLHTSVLEIVDPSRGVLVASQRLPGYFIFLLESGLALRFRQTEQGEVFDVFRVSLRAS